MTEDKIIFGTPPPAMLPARNYCFKIKDEHFLISIPRRGSYHELDPEFFSEDAGEFDIFDEKLKVLYLPSITKVLFATKKYPNLEANHMFIPYVVALTDDGVDVVGQIVEILAKMPNDLEQEETDLEG